MKFRYSKIITPVYIINMFIQAILSLLSPVALMFLVAWLLDKYTSVGAWIYVVLIIFGVFSGLYSMVVFIINSGRALEALEKQNKEKEEEDKNK